MKNWKLSLFALAVAALISGPVMAQVDYSEDFESYSENSGGNDGDLGGGWNLFANVFSDYPGCSSYLYQYGPFPAPNNNDAVSAIRIGSTGKALDVFSDYANADHGSGNCIETNVYQEVTLTASDAGTFEFIFDTQAPNALGTDVSTYGFVKLLDPNNGYSLDLFQTVSTASAGTKTISVDLDATADGKILQWGFANTASNYESSSRYYDNVTFALEQTTPPSAGGGTYEGVPTLGTYGLLVLLLLMGATAAIVLVRRD